MLWFERLYLQDVVDVRSESVSATKAEMIKKANSRLYIDFNYEIARQICEKSVNGAIRLDQALAATTNIKSKKGRENNKQVIELLHPYFARLKGNFYSVDKELFRYGPALSCQVKALGHVYLNHNGTFYWIQFRKTGILTSDDVLIIAAVLRMVFLDQPDFRDFTFKLLDVGAAPFESRMLREYDIRGLPELSSAAIDEFFAPVHRAVSELRSEGFEPTRSERRPRTGSPGQDEFDF